MRPEGTLSSGAVRISVHMGEPLLWDKVVEGQGKGDNSHVPPAYLLSVLHPLTQEAVKEGKDFVLGLGGRHLGSYGWNLIVS